MRFAETVKIVFSLKRELDFEGPGDQIFIDFRGFWELLLAPKTAKIVSGATSENSSFSGIGLDRPKST